MKNWKETCLEDARSSSFWQALMSTPALGEQELQLWLCLWNWGLVELQSPSTEGLA